MAIAGVRECVFVVYTLLGVHMCSVSYDIDFVAAMMPQLRSFFVKNMLPVLLRAGDAR